MDYKIVLSDIDGTVITTDHRVLLRTAAAIRQIAEKGIPFALVSARMPEAIYPIIEEIGVRAAVISYNGALVITPDGTEIHDERMTRTHVEAVLHRISGAYPQAPMSYYAGHTWYVRDRADPEVRREEEITTVTSVEADFDALIADDILPNKLFVMGKPELIACMERELAAAFPISPSCVRCPISSRSSSAQCRRRRGSSACSPTTGLTARRHLPSATITTISKCCAMSGTALRWAMHLMKSRTLQTA